MKKNITIIFLTTAMIFLKIFLFAQNSNYVEKNRKIDSLLYVLKISKVDTTRVNTYDNLCKAFQLSNPNTALYFGTIGLNLAIDINFKKGMAQLYNNIGIIHTYKGNFEKAIEFYFKYLKICEELGDKGGLADSYNNIGIIYKNKGDYDLAIDYYFKSLKIREFINDKKGMATSYGNIGILYKNKGNYDKSLEFNIKSYKIYEELGDKKGLSISFVNIGIVYYYKGEYDKALESYFKSTIIQENLGEKKGLAETFNNIGIIYKIKGEFDKALEFYLKSLKIKIEIDAKNGIASTYNNIGELYLDQGLSPLTPIAKRVNLINEAKKQQLLSLKIAKEIGAKEMMYYAYESLAQCESALGNYKEAYDYHVLYSQIHDSVFTKESDEKIAEMSARYDSEKKQLQIEKLGKEKKLQFSENKKQRIIILFVTGSLMIVIFFSIFIFRLFIQKKKLSLLLVNQKQKIEIQNTDLQQANEEINAQKNQIESQRDLVIKQKEYIEGIHKEVTDSINYAERIQRSFMATKELLDENLTEYFVFFRPKDVVSGDFYWAGRLNNGNFALITADSTGHGVPGAIMSILNISSIENAIEQGLYEPSEIFNKIRRTIIARLKKDGSPDGGKDGMDASLICFDFVNQKFTYSSANNPIWVIRENKLVELNYDKMPIGKHDNDQISFTQHEFQIQKGDVIYTLTDGMSDQFGGKKGKKFLSKNLKNLLNENNQKSMSAQKELLDYTFENWINNNGIKYEQTDDITIIGIRLI